MPQTGPAEVYIYTSTEEIDTFLDILDTTGGQAHPFLAEVHGPIYAEQFEVIGRVPHYTVTFSGSTLPHAIQVDLVHDPDKDITGGVGKGACR